MMAPNDVELLQQYLRGGSEEAFATLVHRHVDLVYSAAVRQVRLPQLAEEIAQCVFLDLCKNAARLTNWKSETLAAWLYQVTRRTAVDFLRRESRRESREKLAAELSAMNEHPSLWSQIEPLLDEAMERLEPSERNIILLRFFESKSLREVGQALGASEEAAQKRVSRAVERLRDLLSKRGVGVGAGGLVALLSANAVQSAPLGLATTICTTAASGAALPAFSLAGTTKLIAMTTMQKIVITAAVAAGLGAGLYGTHQAAQWRQQAQGLQQLQEPLNEQVNQLQRERDEATTRLSAMRQENEQLRQSGAELPRLRGEVARLREKAAEGSAGTDPQFDSALKTWAWRASRLRQRLNQTPGQQIPELQLLDEKGWFDAVKGMNQLETDDDFNKAFSNARNIAKNQFGSLLQQALRAYTAANAGALPQDLAQLKPFFDQPIDDSVFQRYKLLQTGQLSDLPDHSYLVAENAPLLDEDNDATYKFTLYGTDSHSGNRTEDAVKDSVIQYANAHDDLLPTDPAQLTPYLKQAIDPEKIRALMSKVPPGVTTLRQLNAVLH